VWFGKGGQDDRRFKRAHKPADFFGVAVQFRSRSGDGVRPTIGARRCARAVSID